MTAAQIRSFRPLVSPTPIKTLPLVSSTPRITAKPRFVETSEPLPPWKRAVDLSFCVVALPVLAWCALFAALLMRLTSPGPIFFRQERVGYLGRKFKLYKFRTMHVNAETRSHQAHLTELIRSNAPLQKMDAPGDNRLIFGGRLLRASGLDELPQIINVLRGEMSLVGPRPCILYEYEQFSAAQRERCRSVPGLTGLWQVSGKNHTTFEEMIRLDIEYASRKSLGLDLKIILLTPAVLLGQLLEARRRRRAPLSAPPFSRRSHADSHPDAHAGADVLRVFSESNSPSK